MLVGAEDNCHATRRRLEKLLRDRYELEHTTLQIEHQGGELLEIELPEQYARSVSWVV